MGALHRRGGGAERGGGEGGRPLLTCHSDINTWGGGDQNLISTIGIGNRAKQIRQRRRDKMDQMPSTLIKCPLKTGRKSLSIERGHAYQGIKNSTEKEKCTIIK